jgi:3-hexulose-6-phosphate synthase/6-phospho-3-hexuloisomerase
VLGAPLTVDADAFRTADGDLEGSLRLICRAIHDQDNVPTRDKDQGEATDAFA